MKIPNAAFVIGTVLKLWTVVRECFRETASFVMCLFSFYENSNDKKLKCVSNCNLKNKEQSELDGISFFEEMVDYEKRCGTCVETYKKREKVVFKKRDKNK